MRAVMAAFTGSFGGSTTTADPEPGARIVRYAPPSTRPVMATARASRIASRANGARECHRVITVRAYGHRGIPDVVRQTDISQYEGACRRRRNALRGRA